jgi:hypothetical protein
VAANWRNPFTPSGLEPATFRRFATYSDSHWAQIGPHFIWSRAAGRRPNTAVSRLHGNHASACGSMGRGMLRHRGGGVSLLLHPLGQSVSHSVRHHTQLSPVTPQIISSLQTPAVGIIYSAVLKGYTYVLGGWSFNGLYGRLKKSGRGGLQTCQMLRIPHCLDTWLTDGGKGVSPTRRPRSTPYKHYFSASGTNIC